MNVEIKSNFLPIYSFCRKPPSVLVQCDKGTEFSVSENAFTSERKNYSQVIYIIKALYCNTKVSKLRGLLYRASL